MALSTASKTRLGRLLSRGCLSVARERCLIGSGLMRVSMGLCIVSFYLLHYRQRFFLWGPDGVWPFNEFRRFAQATGGYSLYSLSGSPAYFNLIFHAGILVTLIFTLGWHTRLFTGLTYIFLWSLYTRNGFITDGGDNIARLVLFYMIFMNTGAYFSIDRDLAKRPDTRMRAPRPWRSVRGMVHNAGLALVIFQLCVMYTIAAMHKISGPLWQSGTAMYYVMQVRDFSWSPVVAELMRNEYAMVLVTYGTVFWQISFPFLLLNRFTRVVAVAAGFLFHVGIAYSMRLISFSWFMVSLYFVLFTDEEYRGIAARLRVWLGRKRLTVFYDGWCSVCRASVRAWRRADFLGLLEFISFREPAAHHWDIDLASLEKRMEARATSGTRYVGISAIEAVLLRTALAPVALLTAALRILGLGDRLYGWLAAHRMTTDGGPCHEQTEATCRGTAETADRGRG